MKCLQSAHCRKKRGGARNTHMRKLELLSSSGRVIPIELPVVSSRPSFPMHEEVDVFTTDLPDFQMSLTRDCRSGKALTVSETPCDITKDPFRKGPHGPHVLRRFRRWKDAYHEVANSLMFTIRDHDFESPAQLCVHDLKSLVADDASDGGLHDLPPGMAIFELAFHPEGIAVKGAAGDGIYEIAMAESGKDDRTFIHMFMFNIRLPDRLVELGDPMEVEIDVCFLRFGLHGLYCATSEDIYWKEGSRLSLIARTGVDIEAMLACANGVVCLCAFLVDAGGRDVHGRVELRFYPSDGSEAVSLWGLDADVNFDFGTLAVMPCLRGILVSVEGCLQVLVGQNTIDQDLKMSALRLAWIGAVGEFARRRHRTFEYARSVKSRRVGDSSFSGGGGDGGSGEGGSGAGGGGRG